uniref:NADH-ubiquinone oxidoreductase chain 5 n=1 Tax=Angaria neglecta TaxID=1740283 RepID=A0A0S1F5J9_9VEST|nr:NADH dehydrogenase subunit 5 [Angaria neglecta]ALK03354.1 NADH dehydrogenase subunit 5 [Angaria neglecta]
MMLFNNFSEVKSSSISSFILFAYSITLLPFTIYFFLTNNCILMEWEILSTSSTSLSLSLILDPVSVSFSNVVCLISACVMLFSSSYMEQDIFLSRFIALVMMFVLSMNLLVFIPNLAALLIGWDGLGIVSFALVIYYQNTKSLSAGMLTALANRIGDVMLLISIGLCVIQGHWNILFMWENPLSPLVAFCLVVAGMTKSAQIPFSSWLPAAMAAPTPVSALVHSSTLVTAGVFILIRFFPFLTTFSGFNAGLLFISVMTMLMAGIGANYEYDLKKVIALSTLSQLGVMMMSLSLNMPYLALFHLYTHALFKAMLFLCAGAIIHNNNNCQDLRQLGNLWQQMPLTTSCLNVANLALCGAPFMSGFYSKDLILETSLFNPCNFLMLSLIFVATGMTAAYTIRLSIFSLWGQSNHFNFHQNFDEDVKTTSSIMLLSVTTIMIGELMQNNILAFNKTILLPQFHKLLTIAVTLLGAWGAVVIWQSPELSKLKVKKSLSFNSLMWFFAPLSTQPIILTPLKMGLTLHKSLDQGWLEILGGRGILNVTKKIIAINQTFQAKLMTTFIMVSLTSLLLMVTVISPTII